MAIAFSLAEEDLRAPERRGGSEADWDRRYADEDHTWSGNPNGTLIAELDGVTPGRALDVGAGEGADARWLAERGWQVSANDISGNALARIGDEADRRGLAVDLVRSDINEADPFASQTYDLVSLQYGSFTRTPDARGLRNLLGAVAPGGTLLAVHHDLAAMREPVDVATTTRMYDADAYVGVEAIAAALRADPQTWQIEVEETRPRPAGAVSTHHVDDVVLRARRVG